MSWATAENMARQEEQAHAFRVQSAWSQYDRELQEYRKKMEEYEAYEQIEEYLIEQCKEDVEKIEYYYDYIKDKICNFGTELEMPATLEEFNDFSVERRQEYVAKLIRIGDQVSEIESWHGNRTFLLGRIKEWSDYLEFVPGSLFRALRLVADYADFCRGEECKTTIEDVLQALEITDKNGDLDKTGKEMLSWHEHEEWKYRRLFRGIYALAYYLENIDRPEEPIAPKRPVWPRSDGEISYGYW